MKIRMYSDIHNEFKKHSTRVVIDGDTYPEKYQYHYRIPEMEFDDEAVLILCGDIDSDKESLNVFLMELVRRFRYVLYVPGNHEYYNHSMEDMNSMLLEMNAQMGECFHAFIEDQEEFRIDDVLFVGSTLWTDMGRSHPIIMESCRRGMSDYRYISLSGPSLDEARFMLENVKHGLVDEEDYHKAMDVRRDSKLWPTHTVAMHQIAKENIMNVLKANEDDQTIRRVVAVTHHYPCEAHFTHGHSCDMTRDLSYAYYCTDMDEVVRKVDFWFTGHGHNVGHYYKDDCIIYANAVGYDRHEFLPTQHRYYEV